MSSPASRQAEIKREADRVEAIQKKIQNIRAYGLELANKSAKVLHERISEVDAIVIDEAYQEFDQVAQQAKDATMATLSAAYSERKQFEDDQEALRVQQEQLAEQKRQQDEADRIARQQREAEQAAIDAKNRKEAQERADAQALVDAENQRKADELQQQAEAQRLESERLAKLAADLEEKAKPKPEPVIAESPAVEVAPAIDHPVSLRPTFDQIVEVLAEQFEVSDDEVRSWIQPV